MEKRRACLDAALHRVFKGIAQMFAALRDVTILRCILSEEMHRIRYVCHRMSHLWMSTLSHVSKILPLELRKYVFIIALVYSQMAII